MGSVEAAQGPAVGFLARRDRLMWGLFNQNPLAFAGDSDREDGNITCGGDRGAWFAFSLGLD